MDDLPLVSVKTITYNHEPYIRQCIEGVLMQKTNFKYEYIIGEDCSTDGTRAVVMEYAEKYPDIIKVITSNQNVGARANGIRVRNACKGKYQATCEGDDYWTDPNKLQKQVDFLEANPDYVGVYTNYNICNRDGKVFQKRVLKKNHPSYFDRLSVFGKHSSQLLTVLYKTIPGVIDQMSQMDEFAHFANGDRIFAILMAQHGKIKYLDFISGTYRWGSGIHSTKSARVKREGRFELYRKFKQFFRQNEDIVSAINQRMNELYLEEICRFMLRGNFKRAFHINNLRKKETGMPFDKFFLRLLKYVFTAYSSRIKNIITKKPVFR